MLLGNLGSDKCFTCDPYHLNFLFLQYRYTCRGVCINVCVYPTSGHYGSANWNGLNTKTKLIKSKKWMSKEGRFERRVSLSGKGLHNSVCVQGLRAESLQESRTHRPHSNLISLWGCFFTLEWCCWWYTGCSTFTLCLWNVKATFGGEWLQWLTWNQSEAAPCERPLCKCGFWGISLPPAEYGPAVAALVWVVAWGWWWGVGPVAVVVDAVDASVTVKAMISSFFLKKNKGS